MKSMKYVFLLSFFILMAVESQAQLVSIRIGRPTPPPPPRYAYQRSACPGAASDYIWHDGRWSWDDYVRDYVWVAGYWERIPPPPPHYCRDDHRDSRGRYRNEPRGNAYGYYKKRR
jgi:hypothetical protein